MEVRNVNLKNSFAKITEHWDPHIVGELNGQQVKLAKLKGEIVAHTHENEDELFLVLKGILIIELKDERLVIKPGEFTIIPKGVEHKPIAQDEVEVLLFEPSSTLHTGNTVSPLTKTILKRL